MRALKTSQIIFFIYEFITTAKEKKNSPLSDSYSKQKSIPTFQYRVTCFFPRVLIFMVVFLNFFVSSDSEPSICDSPLTAAKMEYSKGMHEVKFIKGLSLGDNFVQSPCRRTVTKTISLSPSLRIRVVN